MSNLGCIHQGLKILEKYTDIIGASHDMIYAGTDDLPLTAEEVEILNALGWFLSDSTGSWTIYV